MPPAEMMPAIVSGAVLGVLVTLGTLLALVHGMDTRWITRAEYVATLQGIQNQLEDIKKDVREMRAEGR